MAKSCESCGFTFPEASYALLDYCADCGKDLCNKCMEIGCCGNVPALSGMDADNDDAEDDDAS